MALRRRIFASPAGHGDVAADRRAAHSSRRSPRARSTIREPVERYLDAHDIRLVHIRNIMSLPYNLPATLAFYGLAVDRPDIGFLMQHHDLYWEGPNAQELRRRPIRRSAR